MNDRNMRNLGLVVFLLHHSIVWTKGNSKGYVPILIFHELVIWPSFVLNMQEGRRN